MVRRVTPRPCSVTAASRWRIIALHDLQRQFRPFNPEIDGLLLTNTWANRSRDGRVCESFMHREIDAAPNSAPDVIPD